MICPTCTPWCATTERQFEIRQKNMADAPDAKPFLCPSCGGVDWATTREKIVPTSRFAAPWPFKKPPSWQTIRIMNAVAGGFCLAGALTTSIWWLVIVDAFLAGVMLAGIAVATAWIYFTDVFAKMTSACDKMIELNNALIQDKVEIIMGRPDDTPPTAPKLH